MIPLPPIDSFWIKLKNQNLFAVENEKFIRMRNSGTETIMKKLRLMKDPQNAKKITVSGKSFRSEKLCRRFATSSAGKTIKMSNLHLKR